jgi:predicted  nucleic acid-binding Zn-ribbon protein
MSSKNNKRKLNEIKLNTDSQEEINKKIVSTVNLLLDDYSEHRRYVTKMNDKFKSLGDQLKNIEKQLEDLKSEVSDIEGRVDEVEGQIEN